MQKFKDVNELVKTIKPDYPVYCIRPESIKVSCEFFKKNFPGKVLYAVKTNSNGRVIKNIIKKVIGKNNIQIINLDYSKYKNKINSNILSCLPLLPILQSVFF